METTESTPVSTTQTSSLITRITNVFASPNELFAELSQTKPITSSWLVPLIISILMALFVIMALQLNESLKFQLKEIQSERIQELINKGKMTQEQAERATGQTGSAKTFIIWGGLSATIMTTIIFFLISLIFWVAAKIGLKFNFNYTKMLEIYGLTTLISSLGTIVTVLMMYLFDNVRAAPSFSIFIMDKFNLSNDFHILLSQLNFFTIWQIGILGYGIAKVSNKPTSAGLILSYALWLIWVVTSSFLGFGYR